MLSPQYGKLSTYFSTFCHSERKVWESNFTSVHSALLNDLLSSVIDCISK